MPDQPPTQTTQEDHQKQEALAAFTATLHSVGTNLETPLRDRAATIAESDVALQRQEAELAEHTARLARQNAQWAGWADETREELKEIGDVQNWAEMIERDLLILEEMMDGVERREEEDERERDGDRAGEEDGSVPNGHSLVNGHGNGSDLDNGKGKTAKRGSRGWLSWW